MPPPPPGHRRAAARAARRASSRTARRARLAAATLLVTATALGIAASGGHDPRENEAPRPGELRVRLGHRQLATVPLAGYVHGQRVDRGALEASVRRALPARARLRRGRATITFRVKRAATARRASLVRPAGGTVKAAATPTSARVRAPVVRQALRNNCETAALSILLATQGIRAGQLELQRRLPRSGPLDPRDDGSRRIWGDPDRGFVGRPDGGGTAGGFGVYPGPVAALASRYGARLVELTGVAPGRLYARLRRGRPVIAWIGLSDGPYGEWVAPDGDRVRVNFGEHTVVLTGIETEGRLRIVNPLQGTRELWTRDEFERLWQRLDRRALGA